jgi:hypothetical protein
MKTATARGAAEAAATRIDLLPPPSLLVRAHPGIGLSQLRIGPNSMSRVAINRNA